MRIYIVWVKGKEVTHKNPLSRMFRNYLTGKPYPRDTCENNSLARLFIFQSCAPHVLFCGLASCELLAKSTDFQISSSLHQLNTKPNIIKSHKIQGTKLEQLQHFLSWNKANIKHSCKSQLYNLYFPHMRLCILFSISGKIQVDSIELLSTLATSR